MFFNVDQFVIIVELISPQNTKKPTSKSMEAGFNYVGSEGLEPPTPSV